MKKYVLPLIAATTLTLGACGQLLDVHNPAGQGLVRVTPYMSPWSQRWNTNGSGAQAAAFWLSDTNAAAAFWQFMQPFAYAQNTNALTVQQQQALNSVLGGYWPGSINAEGQNLYGAGAVQAQDFGLQIESALTLSNSSPSATGVGVYSYFTTIQSGGTIPFFNAGNVRQIVPYAWTNDYLYGSITLAGGTTPWALSSTYNPNGTFYPGNTNIGPPAIFRILSQAVANVGYTLSSNTPYWTNNSGFVLVYQTNSSVGNGAMYGASPPWYLYSATNPSPYSLYNYALVAYCTNATPAGPWYASSGISGFGNPPTGTATTAPVNQNPNIVGLSANNAVIYIGPPLSTRLNGLPAYGNYYLASGGGCYSLYTIAMNTAGQSAVTLVYTTDPNITPNYPYGYNQSWVDSYPLTIGVNLTAPVYTMMLDTSNNLVFAPSVYSGGSVLFPSQTVVASGVNAAIFNGQYWGDGSHLSGVSTTNVNYGSVTNPPAQVTLTAGYGLTLGYTTQQGSNPNQLIYLTTVAVDATVPFGYLTNSTPASFTNANRRGILRYDYWATNAYSVMASNATRGVVEQDSSTNINVARRQISISANPNDVINLVFPTNVNVIRSYLDQL